MKSVNIHRLFSPLLAVTALLLMSGCAHLKPFAEAQKPTAEITQVTVSDMSLNTITLNARVAINNPNPFKLSAAGLALDIRVADRTLAHVKQPDNHLTLSASGRTEVSLPITLRFSDIIAAGRNLKGKSEVPYGIDGEIDVALPVGSLKVPVSYRNTLPIPSLPDIQLNNVTLLEAGFTKVRLQLDMTVSNLNAFAIDLQQLSFNLAAQGKAISSGEVKAVSLAKGGRQQVSLPLTLSLTELGSTLLRLLKSDRALTFSLDGQARIVPAIEAWSSETMAFRSEKRISL
jgi:LEA14-like dessication related protein